MKYEELDARKMSILKAIIDDYIASVEPVGSRTIAKKYDMGLSSATIRNEMADLEEMGYLSQPHTSAGRIPSDKGYRLYVDKLMDPNEPVLKPTQEDLEAIRDFMQRRIHELNQMVRAASEIVSRITHYTAIGMAGSVKKHAIKALQILSLDIRKLLVVVVLDNDIIKNQIVKLSQPLLPEELSRLSVICANLLTGNKADEITAEIINDIIALSGIDRERVLPIVEGILECIKQCDSAEIYTEGTANLLEHPEFNNLSKAKTLLELLNKEEELAKLLHSCEDGGAKGIVIRIGTENELLEVSDCSVITATYSVDGINLGTIGVIGPTRMDYGKVISALEYVRKRLLSE
ncbi:MAG TPA: heat-inducible transcription repressor HrcA [Candidatus Egerieisoma faecipullorum]|uniref:Heat-inducible transcription repressor HrcA n=1 Tax=Candidatus Egerieisoma faecipullorum TaxID=2840963 RepID=A0A9D1I7G1_9CLOT|nr:heat-inducible transcription repressor HrcA [Candidatus Egerieisoma faecipullorum]